MEAVKLQGLSDQVEQKALTRDGKLNDDAKRIALEKSAREFESLFVYQLLKTMRTSVEKMKSEKDAGLGNDVMMSIADQAVANQIANTDAFGIAKLLIRNLNRKIEASEPDLDQMNQSGTTVGLKNRDAESQSMKPDFIALEASEIDRVGEEDESVHIRNWIELAHEYSKSSDSDVGDKEKPGVGAERSDSISRRRTTGELKNDRDIPTK